MLGRSRSNSSANALGTPRLPPLLSTASSAALKRSPPSGRSSVVPSAGRDGKPAILSRYGKHLPRSTLVPAYKRVRAFNAQRILERWLWRRGTSGLRSVQHIHARNASPGWADIPALR